MSLIDKHLPRYQFSETHRTRVRASPDAVMRTVFADRPPDRLRDVLLAMRTVPSRLLGRVAPQIGKQIFTPLESDASETVAGLIGRFWQLDGGLVPFPNADAFARFAEPGIPKLVTGFRAMFQSFYTTKDGGMGMGLSLSRSIVEAHGGHLSAAPNQPNGAIFRFTLPVVEPSDQ